MEGREVGGDGVRLDNRGSRRGAKRPHDLCHNPRADLAHDHVYEVVHHRVLLRWEPLEAPMCGSKGIRASGEPAHGAAAMGHKSLKITNEFGNKLVLRDYEV